MWHTRFSRCHPRSRGASVALVSCNFRPCSTATPLAEIAWRTPEQLVANCSIITGHDMHLERKRDLLTCSAQPGSGLKTVAMAPSPAVPLAFQRFSNQRNALSQAHTGSASHTTRTGNTINPHGMESRLATVGEWDRFVSACRAVWYRGSNCPDRVMSLRV
jgi:hypothetical protein